MATEFHGIVAENYIFGDATPVRKYTRLATTDDTNWTTSATLAFSDPTLTITGLTAGTSRGLIDSVEPVDDDRILIKNAGAASAGAAADDGFNGIWLVTGGTTTTLTLIRDADWEVGSATTLVEVWNLEGTVNATTKWVCTTDTTVANSGANDTTWVQNDLTGTLSVDRGGTGVSTFGGTNTILYTPTVDTLDSITTANNSVLVTDGSGVPSLQTTLPDGLTIEDTVSFGIRDTTTPAQQLTIASNSDASALTADRELTIDVNDADRTIDLGGDLTLGGNFTTTPANDITFTTTGSTSLTLPTSGTLANQSYVDAVVQGLDVKNSVRLATEADTNWTTSVTITYSDPTLTITGLTAGVSRGLINGVEPVDGNRILIKDAGAASAGAGATDVYNGIWDVTGGTTTTLTLTRSEDADEDAEVTAGLFTFTEEGTTCADCGFVLTTDDPITVNTTPLVFAQFSGAGQITAGDGLQKSGNELSVDLKANGGLVIESTEIAVDLGASNITGTLAVGDGGTGATTLTSNGILFGQGTSAVGVTASANNSILVTSGAGVPSLSTSLPSAVQANITEVGTITSGTWNGDVITVPYGGTGLSTITTNALIYGQGTGNVSEVTPAASSVLVSDGSNVPGWNTTLPSGLTIPSPIITGSIFDVNSNELITLVATGSAVNEFTITNAATGNGPTLSATGTDANIDMDFQAKGTGVYNFLATSDTSSEIRLYEDTDSGSNYIGHQASETLGGDTTYTWPIAPGTTGFVLTSNTSGDLTWFDPASIGTKRDFLIQGASASTTGTSPVTIGNLAWDNSDLGGSTTRTVTFWHVTGSKTLTVDVYDGTSIIGTTTTTASTSGIATFTFTNPGVDARLEFRISQGTNGAPRPTVFGLYATVV